jgi:signal transduction histidine kinase
VDGITEFKDPHELAFRTARRMFLAKYAAAFPLVWLLTGFQVPMGRSALVMTAAATLVANALCHLYLVRTRRHVPATYASMAADSLFTIWVVFNTGMLSSPFLMLLPLFPVLAFHAEFSHRRTIAFTGALLAVLTFALVAWVLSGGRVPAWSTSDYPGFTLYVLYHQLMTLVSFALTSVELSPMADAVSLGQARLEASLHRAELGASLGAIHAGLEPHLEGIRKVLDRGEELMALAPEKVRRPLAPSVADYRAELGRMRRALADLGRFLAGAEPPSVAAVPVTALLERAVGFMGLKHARLGRTVLFEQGRSAGVIVRCDPDEVHQALVGLMENSLSRREEGKPLRIRLWAEAREAGTVLALSDNGEPLGPETLAAMQGSAPPHDPADPASGLFQARRAVEGQGGTLKVAGSSGAGTVFEALFPGQGTETP